MVLARAKVLILDTSTSLMPVTMSESPGDILVEGHPAGSCAFGIGKVLRATALLDL